MPDQPLENPPWRKLSGRTEFRSPDRRSGGGKDLSRRADRLERTIHADFPTPYNLAAQEGFSLFPGITRKLGTAVVALEEARTACALEHFCLTNERLPAELSELVSEYLAKVLAHVFGQNELRYLPTPDGQYRLYSIGWNERDDENGDWVWWSAPR